MRLAIVVSLLSSSAALAAPTPPVAATRPHAVTTPFGVSRNDEYYWLRDDARKNPEMLANLKAENDYTDAMMAPLKPLKDKLEQEFLGRLKQDDNSVPYARNGYSYYRRYQVGADYPLVARRKIGPHGQPGGAEEILLDEPAMGRGKGYFAVGDYAISDSNRLMAFAEDDVGRRQYVLRVKDLATGKYLADEVPDVEPNLVWAGDNKTILYVEKDPVTLLSKRVKAHVLGTPAASDRLVYEEQDDSFYIGLERTVSDKFICIGERATVMTEQRCAPVAAPDRMTVIAPRTKDVLYQANHAGGRWVMRSNKDSANYQLYSAPTDLLAKAGGVGKAGARWTALTPASNTAFIDDYAAFDRYVAVVERSGGNKRLRILSGAGPSTGKKALEITEREPAYNLELTDNHDPASPWLRYDYSSLVTPETVTEVNVMTGAKRVLKVQPVPGYNPRNYVTERVWTTARDGHTRIPVSLVHRKDFKRDGTAAMLQYAYGSYGASTDPEFDSEAVSLMDRGMVYAIAHIRGGQEMGRGWFDDGHLAHKVNSFTDFIDVTRDLVARGYAAKGRVAALGGSAGGLLMGGIANMGDGDYREITAMVPFVDLLTTMLDTSIPLTSNEFDEWGNPARAADYAWMAAYSPYDHVAHKAYPAMFVTTGLWDSQVQYYEPTKWVARLRAAKTDSNPLLFRVNMEAGHGGKSGRLRGYADRAEYTAFMLHQLGIER